MQYMVNRNRREQTVYSKQPSVYSIHHTKIKYIVNTKQETLNSKVKSENKQQAIIIKELTVNTKEKKISRKPDKFRNKINN